MSFSVYLVFLFFHISAAIFWIGGMLSFVFIFRPVLKNPDYGSVKTNLFYELALQFRKVAYYLFAVSLVSGSGILFWRGYRLTDLSFLFRNPLSVLSLKMILFCVLVISSVFHDFFLGPLTQRLIHENPILWEKYRRQAAFFGRINLLLSILIAILGMLFSRGQNSLF
ncbi:copper resistance protein CopD [Leptospira yasudae]|uniref:Copper resistance protein CopD n=1 Tax=Leptospira yasudae TaxID=2202201 RepID=A0A6N4QJI3_9LEPT|nr:copper resistance protein CopD [Leptospira yasudae]TGL80282.1 copper resistance protein CopD [Leptospira yasudae]TGL82159.1 copper resistance protein CopD [Leptospira yasudae]TGL86981.1 copper resistance protein CopD [Leptospira yasudae]